MPTATPESRDAGTVWDAKPLQKARRAFTRAQLEPEHLLQVAARHVHSSTSADGALIELIVGEHTVVHAARGTAESHLGRWFPVGASPGWVAVETGHPVCVADTGRDMRVNPETRYSLQARSVAAAPLFGRSGVFGAVAICSRRPNAFGVTLQFLAGLLASELGRR